MHTYTYNIHGERESTRTERDNNMHLQILIHTPHAFTHTCTHTCIQTMIEKGNNTHRHTCTESERKIKAHTHLHTER